MRGAIIGDIVGSRFEWENIKTREFELFDEQHCRYTDDTVLTLAVAKAFMDAGLDASEEELTASLIDHHLHIVLKRPTSGYRAILSPGRKEVQSRDYYHYTYNLENCLEQLSTIGRLSDAEKTGIFYYGIIDGSIAYLRISQFNISDMDMDQLMVFDKFKKTVSSSQIKAAIVDMRDNPGGYSTDLGILMSCFVTEPYQIGYTQEKIGLGRMDLGPRIPYRVIPTAESQKIDCPIIALVDVNSGSMAEIAALSIKTLPNGYVVGEHFTCPDCGEACEVYSRIVGYIRPVQQWNKGKQAEVLDRVKHTGCTCGDK